MDRLQLVLNKLKPSQKNNNGNNSLFSSTSGQLPTHSSEKKTLSVQRPYSSVGDMELNRITLPDSSLDLGQQKRLNHSCVFEHEFCKDSANVLASSDEQTCFKQSNFTTHKHALTNKRNNIPPRSGLDKAWLVERLRGMELIHLSSERERQRTLEHCQNENVNYPSLNSADHMLLSSENKSLFGSTFKRLKSRRLTKKINKKQLNMNPKNTVDITKETLEDQIEDLQNCLKEERQKSRRDRVNLARLQRELIRFKREEPLKKREIEKEKLETEAQQSKLEETQRHLTNITIAHRDCSAKINALETQIKKFDNLSQLLTNYKLKVAKLKKEKKEVISLLEHYQLEIAELRSENRHHQLVNTPKKMMENKTQEVSLIVDKNNCHSDQCRFFQSSRTGSSASVLHSVHRCLCHSKANQSTSSSQTIDTSNSLNANTLNHCKDEYQSYQLKSTEINLPFNKSDYKQKPKKLENINENSTKNESFKMISDQLFAALVNQKDLRRQCNLLKLRVTELEVQNHDLYLMMNNLNHTKNYDEKSPKSESVKDFIFEDVNHVTNLSLESLCTTYNDQGNCDIGAPELSSPFPWLYSFSDTFENNISSQSFFPDDTRQIPLNNDEALFRSLSSISQPQGTTLSNLKKNNFFDRPDAPSEINPRHSCDIDRLHSKPVKSQTLREGSLTYDSDTSDSQNLNSSPESITKILDSIYAEKSQDLTLSSDSHQSIII